MWSLGYAVGILTEKPAIFEGRAFLFEMTYFSSQVKCVDLHYF